MIGVDFDDSRCGHVGLCLMLTDAASMLEASDASCHTSWAQWPIVPPSVHSLEAALTVTSLMSKCNHFLGRLSSALNCTAHQRESSSSFYAQVEKGFASKVTKAQHFRIWRWSRSESLLELNFADVSIPGRPSRQDTGPTCQGPQQHARMFSIALLTDPARVARPALTAA